MDKATENKARRWAERLGYELRKSRVRHVHIDNFGGYQIIDKESQAVIGGTKYELELKDVEIALANREFDLQYSRKRR